MGRFALSVGVAASLFAACDGAGVDGPGVPSEPLEGIDEPDPTKPSIRCEEPATPSHLMSRFGPMQGVIGTRVRILTAFLPDECGVTGECSVTIGGLDAPIDADFGLLEVLVPFGAESGPLCVTWQGTTECGEDFTVLDAPLLYVMSPSTIAAGSGDTTVTLYGDGFTELSRVQLGWDWLEATYVAPGTLTVVVPEALLVDASARQLMVYSPTSGRCGTYSSPLDLTVQ